MKTVGALITVQQNLNLFESLFHKSIIIILDVFKRRQYEKKQVEHLATQAESSSSESNHKSDPNASPDPNPSSGLNLALILILALTKC